MIKRKVSLQNDFYKYKDIGHLTHYMDGFEKFKKILESKCFKPSYCKERFGEEIVLIPMVSFCNIPLTQVDHFAHYGNYGIGLSREWAIENKVEPVKYLVDNSSSQINSISEIISFKNHISNSLNPNKNTFINSEGKREKLKWDITNLDLEIIELNKLAIKNIQFSKYWETYINVEFVIDECEPKKEKVKINCYNEREWRFIPEFNSEKYPAIISSKNKSQKAEFDNFSESNNKPHISDEKYTLKFELEDLKYLLVCQEEIKKTIKLLKNTFNEKAVTDQLEKGELLILTREKIFKDF